MGRPYSLDLRERVVDAVERGGLPSARPGRGSSSCQKYSPDLNPIEKLFAKLKHWLRKAAARTRDAVCDAIGHILDTVTEAECLNYFIEAGYAPA